jgi:glycosyltransferase involved in cell wall biosynthesis
MRMNRSFEFVLSRDLDIQSNDGRLRSLRSVRQVLRDMGDCNETVIDSVFERYGRKKGLVRFVWKLMAGLVRGRAVPLQVAAFQADEALLRQFEGRKDPIFVLDGVRLVDIQLKLREQYPQALFVVDLDDLMSRRFEVLLETGAPPSLGNFGKRFPGAFAKLLAIPAIGRAICRYECFALRRYEMAALDAADRVVLISNMEGKMLSQRAGNLAHRVFTVPPLVDVPTIVKPFNATPETLRYCFVGSDAVPQNQTAIDELIEIWRHLKPANELLIVGKQKRAYDLPPGLSLTGFVEDLLDIYDGRTVLLSPTKVAGGVKTKFLEAFSYGAPVIGTDLTFEGVEWSDSYLTFDQLGGFEVLLEMEKTLPLLIKNAAWGRRLVDAKFALSHFQTNWTKVLGVPPSGGPV